jgi:hypothetical protein
VPKTEVVDRVVAPGIVSNDAPQRGHMGARGTSLEQFGQCIDVLPQFYSIDPSTLSGPFDYQLKIDVLHEAATKA